MSTLRGGTLNLKALKQNVERVAPSQAIEIARALCRSDGAFWLKQVNTRDEADSSNPVKPFPVHLDYLLTVWNILEKENRIVAAKSRQVLFTWLLASFTVWWARFKPAQAVYYQTKSWEDAVSMVAMPEGGYEGRCQFIESHLPEWLRVEYKPSEGRIQYPNGSIIQALAGGADKIRGKVASIVIEDEYAFQDDQDGVYAAVNPLIQKGSKGIFVSTPNGSEGMFAALYHGRAMGVQA